MSRLFTGVMFVICALYANKADAQSKDESEPLRVSLRDVPWVLEIAAPGFVITQDTTQADGRRYLLASKDSDGIVISATLEKVRGAATLDGCREVFRGRLQPNGPFKLSGVKQSQVGEMAVLEYLIPEVNGVPVNQKNVFGCLVKGDVYIDIHASKAPFKESDQALLTSIVSSATVANPLPQTKAPNSLPTSSAAFLANGNTYFLMHNYDKAIGPYQEALELEKKDQNLDSSKWRVLVDNLAMAYGITGKLAASEEVLKYGISKDPSYPMFYFIMADNYAEKNDFDNTMRYLRLALMYKKNVIPGEALPDPNKDDSLTRFVGNADFRKLAAEFK